MLTDLYTLKNKYVFVYGGGLLGINVSLEKQDEYFENIAAG